MPTGEPRVMASPTTIQPMSPVTPPAPTAPATPARRAGGTGVPVRGGRRTGSTERPTGLPTSRGADLLVGAACLLLAMIVMSMLWVDPAGRGLSHNAADQVFFEWMLRYTAHSVTHLTNPFWTTMLNAPTGVNIASNTAVTVMALTLTPVTLAFGPAVAFVLALTLNLALTAYAWYWLFSRHIARTRTAAVVAGVFCGFAPAMIAHANGHLNFTAGWAVPFLLLHLSRLVKPDARRREVVWVGLLTVVQYSVGAEILFFLGLAVGVYAVVWCVQRRGAFRLLAPRVARRLAVAGLIAGALLAYPIGMQFAGPQAYQGTGFNKLGIWENVLSFGAVPWASLGGHAHLWVKLARNFGEENSFFGPVLAIAAVVYLARLCSRKVWARRVGPSTIDMVQARALAATALFIMVCALGPRLNLASWHSHVPLLWAALQHLPLFDSALPGRFALLLIPVVALLIVSFIDDVSELPRGDRRRTRALVLGVAALLPLVPVPLPASQVPPLPRFISSGDWRHYLPPGTTMVSLPPSSYDTYDAQRWQTATDFAFSVQGGYFLGRGPDGRSTVGTVDTPTTTLIGNLIRKDIQPVLTDEVIAAAQRDLAFWHAGLVVLPDPTPGLGHNWAKYHDELLGIGRELFGKPQRVDDVWLWVVTPVGSGS
jgi:hypothetical protein